MSEDVLTFQELELIEPEAANAFREVIRPLVPSLCKFNLFGKDCEEDPHTVDWFAGRFGFVVHDEIVSDSPSGRIQQVDSVIYADGGENSFNEWGGGGWYMWYEGQWRRISVRPHNMPQFRRWQRLI